MHPIKDIVERVSDAFGPAADPARVEAAVSSLLAAQAPMPVLTGANLWIPLADCSSLLTKTVRSRAYDKIRRIASHLDSASREAGLAGSHHIATSPITRIAGNASASDLIVLARMLDDAARDCSATEIIGFTACSDGAIDEVSAALLSVIPHVLQATTRVVIDVRAATPDGAVHLDAVTGAVEALRRVQGAQEDVLRFRLSRRAARPSEAHAALFLRANGAVMIDGALRAAPNAPMQDIAGVLTATAFRLGRRLAPQGEVAATTLSDRSGLSVRFGGIVVDPGIVSDEDRCISAAFSPSIREGFHAAVGDAYVLPHRIVAAFSASTGDGAAGARLVEQLTNASSRPIALHPLFAQATAHAKIRVGPFDNVRVHEPPESDWFRRGGRLPSAHSAA